MSKSIKELTKIITEFADARGWTNEDPNQLLTAMSIETAELAEYYQWQNEFKDWDEEKKRQVGFEFVDVIFYLFRLAQRSGVDIERYFDEKLPLLEEKFKVGGDHAKAHEEYRENGKNKLYK